MTGESVDCMVPEDISSFIFDNLKYGFNFEINHFEYFTRFKRSQDPLSHAWLNVIHHKVSMICTNFVLWVELEH